MTTKRATGFTTRTRTPRAVYDRAAKADLLEMFGVETADDAAMAEILDGARFWGEAIAAAIHPERWGRTRLGVLNRRLYDFEVYLRPSLGAAPEFSIEIKDAETLDLVLQDHGYNTEMEAKIAAFHMAQKLWVNRANLRR